MSARLRVVCGDWNDNDFDALVDQVVRNTLSFTMLPTLPMPGESS